MLGLSASRAQWLEGWCTRLIRDKSVQMQEFQDGLGRAAFVCGALDYDRPFLAPLYAFAARHAPNSVEPLPLNALGLLGVSSQKDLTETHWECGLSGTKLVTSMARGRTCGRARSWCRRVVAANRRQRPGNKLGTRHGFALSSTPDNAPRAFQRDGKAYLEALGCSWLS